MASGAREIQAVAPPVCCRARQQATRVTECSAIADDRQTFLHGLGVCFRVANRNHASGFFNQAFEACDLDVKVSQRVRLPVVNQDNQPQRAERRDLPHKVKVNGQGCCKNATFRRFPAKFTIVQSDRRHVFGDRCVCFANIG